MFRRLAWVVFLASFVSPMLCGAESVKPGRPNVIVILSDDMGFSDIGCYGGEIQTPNLDSLAAGGLRFTQFYNTARCCPTRAALLTGLYPHQAGIGHMMEDHGDDRPGYRGDLNRSCRTIAEVLRPAGYRTYMLGKWHVTRHIRQDAPRHNWPLQRGFDRFYGMVSGAGNFFDPFSLARDNQLISPFADPLYQPPTYYFTDAITDHAVRFLTDHQQSHAEQPFFMYVAYTAAHWPMHALPEDIAKYRGKYDAGYEPIRRARFEKGAKLGLIDPQQPMAPSPERWESLANPAHEAACMEVYAAMVDRMDQGIGKIVEQLKRSGQLDNTLILYLQDNGGCAELMGRTKTKGRPDGERAAKPSLPPIDPADLPKGLVSAQTRDGYPIRQGPNVVPGPADTYIGYGRGWATVSNTPFREYKHWVHEGGISTPLIAHWPRGIQHRGELRRQPGHLIDIMATCVDLAGVAYPAEATPLEGRSLVPAFANQPLDRDTIYWEHEGNRAVRRGDWKLVAKGPGAPWELYNIAQDRVEAHDLAATETKRLRELVAAWEQYARRAQVLPWIWQPAYEAQAN
ncbi:MAG: arylsulfatase [Planctomycetaceae bacterium]|nr:arylsulfatase [Planctomycetaceae bacterium]